QRFRAFDQKGALGLFLKHKAKIPGAAMQHRERAYLQIFFAHEHARFNVNVFDFDFDFFAAHDDFHQIAHAVERPTPAVDFEFRNALHIPLPERRGESADAENVVEMPVRQKDAAQVFEADAAAKNLALGAFRTIE